MNGYEFGRLLGSLLLAVVIAALATLVARAVMHVEPLDKPAFPVEQLKVVDTATAAVEKGGASAAAVAPAAPTVELIDKLLASADPAAGQSASRVCGVCHNFDKGGPAKVGPNLWGIVGNVHAHMEGFSYSDAMKALHDRKWTYDELNRFLFSPRAHVPGTKMAFVGIKDTKTRANLIAWLRTLADKPEPLPQ